MILGPQNSTDTGPYGRSAYAPRMAFQLGRPGSLTVRRPVIGSVPPVPT